MEEQSEAMAPATMQAIADKLALSITTVSRALNNVPGISAATRERVTKAATDMGYQLSKAHHGAATGSQQLTHAGILLQINPGTPAPVYLVGMSSAAAELNTALTVHCVRGESCEQLLDPRFQPAALRQGLLSGLILVFRWPLPVVRELSKMLPVVSIIHRYEGVGTDFVGIDDRLGVDMLFAHLKELGHTKIGFLGRCAEMHWAASRFAAYVSALTAHGFEYHPEWALPISQEHLTDIFNPLDAYVDQVASLIIKDGVHAWMCSSEAAAIQLHAGLATHGFRVPKDVSITGFHRPMRRGGDGPDLTSVSVSYEAIGSATLRRLLYRIQHPEEPVRNVLFAPEFYAGGTCAPPPKEAAARS